MTSSPGRQVRTCLPAVLAGMVALSAPATAQEPTAASPWQRARERGDLYHEAMTRADRVLEAWLRVIDPETGLTPERYRADGKWT
ncbi:MAG: hypothetical protein ACYTG0_03345, partial [Planctomycetota bacterium]